MPRLAFRGTVLSSQDPDKLGRVHVRLEGYEGVDPKWIRVVQPSASADAGHVFVPESGDEVVVLQGDGAHIDDMYVLGSVYNGDRKPAVDVGDGQNNHKQIRTRTGNLIALDDTDGASVIRVEVGGGSVSIELTQSSAKIVISAESKVEIVSRADVSVCGERVSVTGTTISVSGSTVNISGGDVNIGN